MEAWRHPGCRSYRSAVSNDIQHDFGKAKYEGAFVVDNTHAVSRKASTRLQAKLSELST